MAASEQMLETTCKDLLFNRHKSFLLRRLSETGNDQRVAHIVGGHGYNPDMEEEILRRLDEDPTKKQSAIAADLHVSQWKVWSVIHRNGLEEYDPARRVQFYRFLLNTDAEDANFSTRILWTDESKFSRKGVTNFHNLHYWTEENSRLIRQTSFQRKFSGSQQKMGGADVIRNEFPYNV
ncbi:hypothetical protein NQ318_020876 [Aromia moschata]|uniref:Transposase n=1 Tax=Aromia moschata TaxID=1265417 RepID=A0AAV8XXG2_9CUCU|nr:hypothetical protein NQ318_020876 [Aromia moschata]